jgi:phosphatidate phosphatase APP1
MRYPSSGDLFKTFAHHVDNQYGRVRSAIRRRLGWIRPVKILPYRGYGNQHSWFLMGRVLEDRRMGSPQADDSWWDNMKAMYARFATDEIAGVRVRASIEGHTAESVTDDEGYFRFHLHPAGSSCAQRLWQSVSLELIDQVCAGQGPVTALGRTIRSSRAMRRTF